MNQLHKNYSNENTWTLFGAGYFIHDIIDAIASRNGRVTQIVLNQTVEKKIMDILPKNIEVVSMDDFSPSTAHYFYGFMEQNKKPLLSQLAPFSIHLSNVIHSFSCVSDSASFGEGNYIGAGSVVASNVKIGNFNIINRIVSIGHDTVINDFNNIGPSAAISGLCNLGNRNFLGSNSTILPNIVIGNDITIGAGSVLTKNAKEPGVYVGVPARKKTD